MIHHRHHISTPFSALSAFVFAPTAFSLHLGLRSGGNPSLTVSLLVLMQQNTEEELNINKKREMKLNQFEWLK